MSSEPNANPGAMAGYPANGASGLHHKEADIAPSSGDISVSETTFTEGVSGEVKDTLPRFYFVVSGQAHWRIEGRRFSMGPNTLCHVPAKQVYYEEVRADIPLTGITIRYRAELLPPGVFAQLTALGMVPIDFNTTDASQIRALRAIFNEMLFEQDSRQLGWEAILRSRLLDLAVRALRRTGRYGHEEAQEFKSGTDNLELIARYASRLKSEFLRRESMTQAARNLGMSTRNFTLLFRKVTGQSWRKYIIGLRLKHAAGLLKDTDKPVLSVAFESGYDDLTHFYHNFRSVYERSPLAYRKQYRVKLPIRLPIQRSGPSDGKPAPGFAFRGIKGWFWTTEQYLAEIPYLAGFKMNFLMNCPGSVIASGSGESRRNEWWKPMTGVMQQAYMSIIHACQKHGINFCFSLHPQMLSQRPLDAKNPKHIQAFYQHYAWAQNAGVRWFNICMDGTSWFPRGPRSEGEIHARLVNDMINRLRVKDAEAQLIFSPIACWGDGTNLEHRTYLEALGRYLDPAIYVFWNGDGAVTPRVTRNAAECFKGIVNHRLFLWDNYPVNDNNPTLHLGPLRGRDADLCEVIDGYLSNPMCTQNEINRLPLATCADYAYNPRAYDPVRSVGQAILGAAKTRAQQQALKDLVDAYPGFIVSGGGTGANPIRTRLGRILTQSDYSLAARNLIRWTEDIASRLNKLFPAQYLATKKTIQNDIAWMKEQLARMDHY